MSTSVLVGFATHYGSTREVAEAIARTLHENGVEADIQLLSKVHSLDGYNAVIMGAPLFMFRWHKDAHRFLSRFHKSLISLPVAVFALGPMTAGAEEEFKGAHEQLDKELIKYPWFKPIAVQIFGGKLDHSTLKFPFNFTLKTIPASDLRDWDAIRAWALELKDRFIL